MSNNLQSTQDKANDPLSIAFSVSTLLLFVLLGPLIAFFASGGANVASAGGYALIVVYLVGSLIAVPTWLAFSFKLASFYSIRRRPDGEILPISELLALSLGALT